MANHLMFSLFFAFNLLLITASAQDYYYTTTYTYEEKSSNTGAIIGSISAVFLVISIAFGIYSIFRHRAKTAAAIAAAEAGIYPNNQKTNMPTEEMPMHQRSTNMSPQI